MMMHSSSIFPIVFSCAFLACFDLKFCHLDILSLEFSFLCFKYFYCLSLGSFFLS